MAINLKCTKDERLLCAFKTMFHENMSAGSKCAQGRPTCGHYEITTVGYKLI
jgi:hypothetical protein